MNDQSKNLLSLLFLEGIIFILNYHMGLIISCTIGLKHLQLIEKMYNKAILMLLHPMKKIITDCFPHYNSCKVTGYGILDSHSTTLVNFALK